MKVDERRKLDVVFEGNDPDRVPDEELTAALTFAAATRSIAAVFWHRCAQPPMQSSSTQPSSPQMRLWLKL